MIEIKAAIVQSLPARLGVMGSSLEKTGQKVSVLVVDDHATVRRGICSLLSQDPSLDVICETADGEEAVSKAEELQPDLILLDIMLPGI